MHAVDLRDGSGRTWRLVLRRYVDARRLAEDPWYRPEHEATALQIVAEAGLLAPRLIAEDTEARRCDVPAILETRLPGRPRRRRPSDLDGYLRRAAEALHSIHAVDPRLATALPPYEPYEPPQTLRIPEWSIRPALWDRVLEILSGPVPSYEVSFIHRDFHPGNIVSSRDRVIGVVDWLTACRGPRSVDLARMRLNLAADFGMDAADRFLDLYRERAGPSWSHHPYWDLLDAVDSAQDEPRPRTERQAEAWDRFERWVEAAASELGTRPSP
jgi:aminoglycoside phosphotransferase (APT) family kinase protein